MCCVLCETVLPPCRRRAEHANPRTRGLGVFRTTTVCDGMYGIALSESVSYSYIKSNVPSSRPPWLLCYVRTPARSGRAGPPPAPGDGEPWECSMNPDEARNRCDIAEERLGRGEQEAEGELRRSPAIQEGQPGHALRPRACASPRLRGRRAPHPWPQCGRWPRSR